MLIAGRGDELAVFVSIHPDFPLIDAESVRLREEAEAHTVDSDEASRLAAERMAEAKAGLRKVEDVMRKPVTRKIDAAKRTVMDIFDEAKKNLEATIKTYETKIGARAMELRRQAEAERQQKEETQRKAREEQERLARQARERAAAQEREAEEARRKAERARSEKERQRLEAEARHQEKLAEQNRQRVVEREQAVETLSRDVVVEERTVDLGNAGHFVARKKARILNFEKFVQMVAAGEIPNGYALLEAKQSAVNDRARDLGQAFHIDGVVEVYEDSGVTSRGAGTGSTSKW